MIAKFTFNYNGGFEKKENAVFQQGSIGVDSYQVFAPFLTTTQVYIKTKRNGDLEFSLWKQLDYNSTIGGWLKTATQDELLVDGEMKVVFKFNNLVSQETSLWVRKGTLIVPEMTTYEALRDYVENQEIRIDQIINGATDIAFDKTGTNLNSDFVEEAIKEVNTKSDANAQNITDMKDGTDAFSEILLGTAQIRYNSTKKIVEQVFDDGTTLEVGLELWAIVRNEDSTILKNGEVAAINGVVGQQLSVVHADPSDDNLHFKELGVCTMDSNIAVNGTGKITHFGEVNGIPIANFEVTGVPYAENQELYVSVNGKLTNVQPAKPITHIHAGWVLRTVGSNANIFVYFVKVPHIDHLSDVDVTSGANNDILVRGSDGVWRNSQRLVTVENSINALDDRVQLLEETSDYTFDISNSNRYAKFLAYKTKALYDTSVITLVGDSTGNETTEWFYKFMQHIATLYPKHNVAYTLYGSALEEYPPLLENVQNGESGKAYADIIGISGRSVSSNDKSEYDIVGDIEVVVNVKLNSFTADKYLAGKLNGSGNFSWYFQITSAKYLRFAWSENGTTLINSLSTVPLTINAGDDIWLKATLDVDNGASGNAVNFFYSNDGLTWSTLGATVTKLGVTSIFNSNAKLEFGASNNGSNPIDGYFYSGYVRNGINGGVVASPNINLCNKGDLTFYDTRGNLWTLLNGATRNGAPSIVFLNGSVAGVGVPFFADETRFNKVFALEPDVVFISLGHNDGLSIATYQTDYTAFITQILTKWSNAGIIGMTQNPQISPRTDSQIRSHAKINRQLAKSLVVGNYGFIDIYTMFLKQSNITDLISSVDGVHPTVLGSEFWRDQVIKYMVALTGV